MADSINGPIQAQRNVDDFLEFRESFPITNGAYAPGGYLLTMKDARMLEHCKTNCRGSIVENPASPSVTYSAHGEPVTNASPNQIRVKIYRNDGGGLFAEATDQAQMTDVIIDIVAWGY